MGDGMNLRFLCQELGLAYERYKKATGERERVRTLRYLTGMADGIAALWNAQSHDIIFAVMSAQTTDEMMDLMKGLMPSE
jgi:hypothetical protein